MLTLDSMLEQVGLPAHVVSTVSLQWISAWSETFPPPISAYVLTITWYDVKGAPSVCMELNTEQCQVLAFPWHKAAEACLADGRSPSPDGWRGRCDL